MCGIRAEVGLLPFPSDTTNVFDKRHIVVNLEMLPLCSPQIRAGRPIEKAQVVAQKLNDLCQNLIDPSNLVSTSDPYLSGGQRAAWYIYADLYCFDHDGNIQDAAMISLLAALKSTKLPPITVTAAGEACVSSSVQDRTISLQLTHLPILTTFGIFEEYILADPNLEEESLLTGLLTIVYDEKGFLCSLDKPGGTLMTEAQLKECLSLAKARVGPVVALMDKTVAVWQAKQSQAK